ncbi:sodium channel protein Nach-like isoform 1-T1 [Glossina fuscipes fuscipes]
MFRLKNVRKYFRKNLKNFCQSTSLHGFSYIARTDLTKTERMFWIIAIFTAIVTCVALVLATYFWNFNIPTVTVIDSSHYPIWQVPFPAITLCNFNKISKRKALQLLKIMRRPPNITEPQILNSFQMMVHYKTSRSDFHLNIELMEKVLKLNNWTLGDLREKLMPNCLEMMMKCVWKGSEQRCDNLFQRIPTLKGQCCSFNYYGEYKNNFPVSLRKIHYQIPKHPYRVTGCGYTTGLTLLLDPMVDDYIASGFSVYGFSLVIHDPYNMPDENAETKLVTSSTEGFIRISPESTYATESVREMDVNLRNCLFTNERTLRIMQRYSFVNCLAECRINYAQKKCNCVLVTENLFKDENKTECSVREHHCLMENNEIFNKVFNDFNKTLLRIQSPSTTNFPCNCRPDCESNHYTSELSSGKLNLKLSVNASNKKPVTYKNDNILLHAFFGDLVATRYRREIYTTELSDLANFGGILGLITGISIVSAFEFIYYFTLRPIFNYFNNRFADL